VGTFNFSSTKHFRSELFDDSGIVRPKSTFLTIPILVAGTNSVSSGNILDESFFDKYFEEKLKVPTIIYKSVSQAVLPFL
jgi:hypothetical protein